MSAAPGSRPTEDMLVDVAKLVDAYYTLRPDPATLHLPSLLWSALA